MKLFNNDDADFVTRQLSPLPLNCQRQLIANYEKQPSRREANLYLLRTSSKVNAIVGDYFGCQLLHWTEADFERFAKSQSKQADKIRCRFKGESSREIYLRLCRLTATFNIIPPEPADTPEPKIGDPIFDSSSTHSERGEEKAGQTAALEPNYRGAINRLCCRKWWSRKLSTAVLQTQEQVQHLLGTVCKAKALYVSDPTLNHRKSQRLRNQSFLRHVFLKNDDNQVYSLAELSSLNVSNPKIRKAELMVRMRGFEECAKSEGHQGVFLTLTCPSKYHRSHSKSGEFNPKWQGFTPKQGQKYLTKLFTKIRSTLHKRELKPYGFRVCEPHHDGTPHWHLLLFLPPEQISELLEVFEHYAFLEDGDEPGAKQHRFKVVHIDNKKGSATGYIAKYVSKNIDGSDLDEGYHGKQPQEIAARVDAWAAVWRIRQFQQIGGASVTVWREARRLSEALRLLLPAKAMQIVDAADQSNWQAFTEAMGGVILPRAERPASPYYEEQYDTDTGELTLSKYGDEILYRLKGLMMEGQKVITRTGEWVAATATEWSSVMSGRSPAPLGVL